MTTRKIICVITYIAIALTLLRYAAAMAPSPWAFPPLVVSAGMICVPVMVFMSDWSMVVLLDVPYRSRARFLVWRVVNTILIGLTALILSWGIYAEFLTLYNNW